MPCHAAVCVNFILGAKVQFLCVITQSTGLTFLPSLPTARRLLQMLVLCFVGAEQFHFSKLSSVHSFHSLLRHLLRFEFAVLLFDCERYKLAAQSIPQFFSKLRATVFFAAFFLKRKRVHLRIPILL